MPFSNWSSYPDLLDDLAEERTRWDSAANFKEFDAAIRDSCPDLVDGPAGYAALAQELMDDSGGAEDLVFERIKLVALARPAAELGLGPEWQGYFLSERMDGEEVYAADQFAEPSGWVKVEVSSGALALAYDEEAGLMYNQENWYLKDGKTIVTEDPAELGTFVDSAGNQYIKGELQAPTVEDLRQQHFDTQANRWRRWSDDGGEFEYYHNEDGVWERAPTLAETTAWRRYHGRQFGWLHYDGPSDTWLDPTTQNTRWRPQNEVGMPLASATTAVPETAQKAAAQSPGPDDDDIDEEADQLIVEEYERAVQEAIANVRASGITEDAVSDAEIVAIFDETPPSPDIA